MENLYGFLDLIGDSGSGVGRSWADLLVDIVGAIVYEDGGCELRAMPEGSGAPATVTTGRVGNKRDGARPTRVLVDPVFRWSSDQLRERLSPSVIIIAHRAKWLPGALSVSPLIPQKYSKIFTRDSRASDASKLKPVGPRANRTQGKETSGRARGNRTTTRRDRVPIWD